jgi:hypothetical protein
MARIQDLDIPYLEFAEAAAPGTPAAGIVRIYAKTDGSLYQKDDAGAESALPGAGSGMTYTGYTPALTAATTNPTLGSGSSAAGRYTQNGKLVHAYGAVTFGTSGTNAGSGNYAISLPVTMRTPVTLDGNVLGHGYVYDSSGGIVRHVWFSYLTTTTASIRTTDGSADVTHAAPWAWAASDALICNLTYEAA